MTNTIPDNAGTILQIGGAACFGVLVGWYVYFINRYRKGEVQISDLGAVLGVIGGAGITALFPVKTDLFAGYGIGLAVGFFGYFAALTWLVSKSDNFDSDWFLDGRRKAPQPPYSVPGDVQPTMRPMDAAHHSVAVATNAAAAAAARATAAVMRSRATLEADAAPTNTKAARIIDVCEAEWPSNKDDCSAFVRAVASELGVALTGQADDILGQISGSSWARVGDGAAAKQAADAGKLVIAGLRSGEHQPPRQHGHVVVVVAGPFDPTHGRYPTAYWGTLGGIGERKKTINWAWRKEDRDRVVYAAKDV